MIEREAGIERLFGLPRRGTVIRKIRNRAGLDIEHGQRLVVLRFKGSVSGVDRNHVALVGRHSHRDGQAVEALGMARDFSNQLLACGQIDALRGKQSHVQYEQRKRSRHAPNIHTTTVANVASFRGYKGVTEARQRVRDRGPPGLQ